MKTYEELLNQLYALNIGRGVKLNLAVPQRLCEIFHHPQNAFQTVHIAGTNGKGSVSTKIAKGFELAGKKTALFTSPHISSFRERITINGHMISEEAVTKWLSVIFEKIEEEAIHATFFEVTTLLAFLYFKSENVDVAVIEVGLGGRLDATNVITPLLSVITSISLEHTQILGSTIEDIAKEKCGIIKPNTPLVVGPKVPHDVVAPMAQALKAFCYSVEGIYDDFDLENQAIAQKAMELLNIPSTCITQALKIRPPCRREIFCIDGHHLILDVAHNPDGLERLFKWLTAEYPLHKLHVICGLSYGKDVENALKVICEHASSIYVVKSDCSRGIPANELVQSLHTIGFPSDVIFQTSSIKNSVQLALTNCKTDQDMVIVCGTFFIMGTVRQALDIHEPRDLLNLNESFCAKT